MRSASHAHITPAANAAAASQSSPTGTRPQRRVMRAAWALHRDGGISFANALKTAWQHEKSQAALSALSALRSQFVNAAYVEAAKHEIRSSMPILNYRLNTIAARKLLTDLIDRLVNILDCIDGDPDSELDASDYEDDGTDDEHDDRDLLAAPSTRTTLIGGQVDTEMLRMI